MMYVGSLGRVVLGEGYELKDFGQKVRDVAVSPLVVGGAIGGAGAGLLSGTGVGLGAGGILGAAIGNKMIGAPGVPLGGTIGALGGGTIGALAGTAVGGAGGAAVTKKLLYGGKGDNTIHLGKKFKNATIMGKKLNKFI